MSKIILKSSIFPVSIILILVLISGIIIEINLGGNPLFIIIIILLISYFVLFFIGNKFIFDENKVVIYNGLKFWNKKIILEYNTIEKIIFNPFFYESGFAFYMNYYKKKKKKSFSVAFYSMDKINKIRILLYNQGVDFNIINK